MNDRETNAFVRTRTGSKVHAGRRTSSRTDCGERKATEVRPSVSSQFCERCFSACQTEWLKAMGAMFKMGR